ncbi:hypothetical protein ACFY36_14430 [Actinoplanes sp. NPDC000266]
MSKIEKFATIRRDLDAGVLDDQPGSVAGNSDRGAVGGEVRKAVAVEGDPGPSQRVRRANRRERHVARTADG